MDDLGVACQEASAGVLLSQHDQHVVHQVTGYSALDPAWYQNTLSII